VLDDLARDSVLARGQFRSGERGASALVVTHKFLNAWAI